MLNNKIIYGILILFVGFAMSLNTVTAQVTGEEDQQQMQEEGYTGKVVDAKTGQAVSDVTVQIEGMDKEATTGQNGEFTFKNIESSQQGQKGQQQEGGIGNNPNEVTFTIDHEGYQQFSKTLKWSELQQAKQGGQGQQGQQQGQQGMDDNPLKFELEPSQGQQ